jgi:hypothetical protein
LTGIPYENWKSKPPQRVLSFYSLRCWHWFLASQKRKEGLWAQIKISNATECIVRAKIFKKEACVIMAE